MVDDVSAEELAIDASNVGPVEPRTEAVVVEAVVAAVGVTTNRKSIQTMSSSHPLQKNHADNRTQICPSTPGLVWR